MAIIKHISVKNRFYSDAVEYLTCKFDEYRYSEDRINCKRLSLPLKSKNKYWNIYYDKK